MVEFTPGNEIGIVRAPFDFKPGTWYHLAATFDGTNIRVFVDGAAIKSDECAGSMRIDDSELVIGRGDPEYSSGEYFDGALDEIRIWAVARSPAEIQACMNTRMTGKERGLVAYWNFDDGTATDQSGHGNRGVLNKKAEIVESARVVGATPEQ